MQTAKPSPPETPAHNAVLSPKGAFVVQFHVSRAAGHVPSTGRVEHVASGQVSHFGSWQDLAAFVGRTFS